LYSACRLYGVVGRVFRSPCVGDHDWSFGDMYGLWNVMSMYCSFGHDAKGVCMKAVIMGGLRRHGDNYFSVCC
jgi:hypothetical protein